MKQAIPTSQEAPPVKILSVEPPLPAATPDCCFPAGVPVRMVEGNEKPIEQVRVGDWVVSHTASIRQVLQTTQRHYTGDLITLHVRGFPFPLELTADHPVAVARKPRRHQPGGLAWVPAARLKESDRLLVGPLPCLPRRPTLTLPRSAGSNHCPAGAAREKASSTCSLPVSPSLARLMGVYLARGSGGDGQVRLALGANQDLAMEVRALVQGLFGVQPRTEERRRRQTVHIEDEEIAAWLGRLVPGGRTSRRVPGPFLIADQEVKLSLLLGWAALGRGQPRPAGLLGRWLCGVTPSAGLARDLLTLALSSGWTALACRWRSSYQVAIQGERAVTHFPALTPTRRAQEPPAARADTTPIRCGLARPIEQIETRTVVHLPVHDFAVEEDHSFVAGGLVVHNCGSRGQKC
jgi:hypothetical protein